MDLIKELSDISDHILNHKNNVKNEQATIDAFIRPFIRASGYDDIDPTEVVPQYIADVGVKKDEKVDFAIFKNDKVIMLIECKKWDPEKNSDFLKDDLSQLFRYFAAVPDTRIGVLTNGVLYKFHTDLENPNVMDTEPFFEFNVSDDIQPSLVNVLENFTKDKFDLHNARSFAVDLKHRGEIKQILIAQLETPTDDFVRFFYEAIKPRIEMQDFENVVKRAFHEFLDEQNREEPNNRDGQSRKEPNGSNAICAKPTNLRVTMPNGDIIHRYNGTDTFIEVIDKLGLEEVKRVRPNIVSTEPFFYSTERTKRGKFWVRVEHRTRDRKMELEKIADLLDISLLVETVEKTTKSG